MTSTPRFAIVVGAMLILLTIQAFPPGKITILSYDDQLKAVCEFLDNSPENLEQVWKQFGAEHFETTPALPAP